MLASETPLANLSGLNLSASGPQSSGSWCNARIHMCIPTPFGTWGSYIYIRQPPGFVANGEQENGCVQGLARHKCLSRVKPQHLLNQHSQLQIQQLFLANTRETKNYCTFKTSLHMPLSSCQYPHWHLGDDPPQTS